jgi:hypothetical protein
MSLTNPAREADQDRREVINQRPYLTFQLTHVAVLWQAFFAQRRLRRLALDAPGIEWQ